MSVFEEAGDGPDDSFLLELSALDFTEDVVSAAEALAMFSASHF